MNGQGCRYQAGIGDKVKKGDTVLVRVTIETGELFGTLTAEKEYTIK